MHDLARLERPAFRAVLDCAFPGAHLLHVRRDQRPDRLDAPGKVVLDERVGVAGEERVHHQRLAEVHRGHLRVGRVVQQAVQRMIRRPLLAAVLRPPVDVQRQRGHILAQHAHAGLHGGQAHGLVLAHGHARVRGHHARRDHRSAWLLSRFPVPECHFRPSVNLDRSRAGRVSHIRFGSRASGWPCPAPSPWPRCRRSSRSISSCPA